MNDEVNGVNGVNKSINGGSHIQLSTHEITVQRFRSDKLLVLISLIAIIGASIGLQVTDWTWLIYVAWGFVGVLLHTLGYRQGRNDEARMRGYIVTVGKGR